MKIEFEKQVRRPPGREDICLFGGNQGRSPATFYSDGLYYVEKAGFDRYPKMDEIFGLYIKKLEGKTDRYEEEVLDDMEWSPTCCRRSLSSPRGEFLSQAITMERDKLLVSDIKMTPGSDLRIEIDRESTIEFDLKKDGMLRFKEMGEPFFKFATGYDPSELDVSTRDKLLEHCLPHGLRESNNPQIILVEAYPERLYIHSVIDEIRDRRCWGRSEVAISRGVRFTE